MHIIGSLCRLQIIIVVFIIYYIYYYENIITGLQGHTEVQVRDLFSALKVT